MHKFACYNGEIAIASKISLPVVSSAALYGRGVFTTIAVYNSKPFQWSKHWRRLTENAKTLGIELSDVAEEKVTGTLAEILNINKVTIGRARITFFDEAAGAIWQIKEQRQISFLITSADLRPRPANLRLTISPYKTNSNSPLAGTKSCNYLENLLAFEEAKKRGFDEAIRVNENDEVVSAAMANLFWTRGEEVFTPSLETGALRGTTRDYVLENLKAQEKNARLEELKNADEIFLTSVGLGIARAGSLEKRSLSRSDVFERIRDSFAEFIKRQS